MTFHMPGILLEDVWFQNFAWPKDVQTHKRNTSSSLVIVRDLFWIFEGHLNKKMKLNISHLSCSVKVRMKTGDVRPLAQHVDWTFVAQGCLITRDKSRKRRLISVYFVRDIIIKWGCDELVISFELKHTHREPFSNPKRCLEIKLNLSHAHC